MIAKCEGGREVKKELGSRKKSALQDLGSSQPAPEGKHGRCFHKLCQAVLDSHSANKTGEYASRDSAHLNWRH